MNQKVRFRVDMHYKMSVPALWWARRTCHPEFQLFPIGMKPSCMLGLQNPKLSCHHLSTVESYGCCSLRACSAIAHGVLNVPHFIPCE